ALDQFGVEQPIITVMLRTPPQEMYVFTADEIAQLGINRGEPVRVAELDLTTVTIGNEPPGAGQVTPDVTTEPAETEGGMAYVQLSLHGSEAEAERSLRYARERWAGVLAGREPEIERVEGIGGPRFHVRVPARSA